MKFFKLIILILLFLGSSLHAKNVSLEKVTLQLQWKHQFEFAGFYAAKEKGFYRDNGLDVSFLEYNSKINIVDTVLSGKAQYGLSYSSIIADYLNGKPIVLLANFFKQSPLVLVAQEEIKTPAGLKGKKVMGVSDGIDNITLLTMLEKFNVSLDDIKTVPASFNIDDFVNKRVDAMSGFTTNELHELNKRGIRYTVLDPTVYGTKYYDVNLFTSTKEVQENPLRVQKFIEASIKGWEYALSHQDEIIQLILKKYNTQNKTKEALAFEAKQIEQIMLPNVYPVGSIDKFRIKTMADNFIQSGFVENVQDSENRDLNTFIFQDRDNPLNLTKHGKEFIKNNPLIRVSNENDWQPFDFAENGKAKGYSVDIIKNLAKKIGVEIEFINGYTWSELLKLFDDGKIDMLHVVTKSESRVKKYNYSKAYIKWHGAYFITVDEKNIKSVKDFDNKKIGLIKGWDTTKIFKEKYPKALVVEYKNISDLLMALSLKEVDVIISMISTARYAMMQELITNVKLGGYVDVSDFIVDNKLYFASQKDKPEIVSIFNKALNLFTIEEKMVLQKKWFGANDKRTIKLTEKEQEFLEKHSTITLGTGDSWAPYTIKNSNGILSGYDQDILAKINAVTGANFIQRQGNWSEVQQMAKDKKIDGLSTLTVTKEREKFLNFSNVYISLKKMVMVKQRNPLDIHSISDMDGKTIVIHRGNVADKKASKQFKNSKIIYADTPQKMLEEVIYGKADATFGNGATEYMLSQLGLPYMKNAFALDDSLDLRFAIRKDWNEAMSILNKGLATISIHERMKLKKKWFFFNNDTNTIKLTKNEALYLKKKKEIKVCVDPDWMPLEKIEDGKQIGMSSDYMKIIQSKVDTPFTLVPTKSWVQSLEKIKKRECDILSLAMETPSRRDYLNFTTPYLDLPLVIATTYDKLFISNIKELEGKRIGIVRGYAEKELLQRKYKNIVLINVDSIKDGLTQVAAGKLYGFIENLSVMGYQIQKLFPNELKITGRLNEKFTLSVAVRNDQPLLLKIIEKALDSIDDKTRQGILNQWISIKYEQEFDYALYWYIMAVFFLLLLLLLVGYYILRQYNIRLKQEVNQQVEELRCKDEILLKKHRMSEMGEMLSMIAHQWRQPLGSISSAIMGIEIKMLSGKYNLDDKEEREAFLIYLKRKHRNIQDYVQYLSMTTDEFRNFFNPNKSRDLVPLSAPVESALQIVQKSMETNGIEIIKEYKAENSIELYQNEVMQVILNLLKNSEYNFLDKKIQDPIISIETFHQKQHPVISICDNGGGIPEDIIDKVFDPYFSTKDEKNGAGLGLYMSKKIIEDHHNATLTIKNSRDGVCFIIDFDQ